MAAILIVPTLIVLGGLAAAAGFSVARAAEHSVPLLALRYLLFLGPLLAMFGPLFLTSGDRTNPVRMLLLPIPGSTLYVAQAAAVEGVKVVELRD